MPLVRAVCRARSGCSGRPSGHRRGRARSAGRGRGRFGVRCDVTSGGHRPVREQWAASRSGRSPLSFLHHHYQPDGRPAPRVRRRRVTSRRTGSTAGPPRATGFLVVAARTPYGRVVRRPGMSRGRGRRRREHRGPRRGPVNDGDGGSGASAGRMLTWATRPGARPRARPPPPAVSRRGGASGTAAVAGRAAGPGRPGPAPTRRRERSPRPVRSAWTTARAPGAVRGGAGTGRGGGRSAEALRKSTTGRSRGRRRHTRTRSRAGRAGSDRR